MTLIDVYAQSEESKKVIDYLVKQIKESIERQEKIQESHNKVQPKNPEAYSMLMSYEKQKIEMLLTLSNDLYGRRITSKYVCRKLGINNNDN